MEISKEAKKAIFVVVNFHAEKLGPSAMLNKYIYK